MSWRLIGVGSLSNPTSTSVVYNAPAQIRPQNAVLGCPAGPNDSIFNTPIDNLPVDGRSSAWMATAATWPISMEWDNWGISYADNSTGTQQFKTYYGEVSYPQFVVPEQGPKMHRQGGDYQATFGTKGSPDHHILTVRRTDCSFWESYDNYLNGFTRACQDGSAGCNIQSAITYKSMDYAGSSAPGTNAASIPLAPVSWRLEEIKSGQINHAGFFTTNLGGLLGGAYEWPALGTAGGCDPRVCPNALPMGTRLRLKADFNIGSVCRSGNSQQDGYCTTIMTAMKKYGFFVGDEGSTNSLEFLLDVSMDNTVMAAVKAIGAASISMRQFEAVDESSLEVTASSYQVCPYQTSCKNGQNSYVQPLDQAVLVATTGNGTTVSTPIAIQGVAIGLGVPAELPIAAGAYQFQIPYWVNGTSNQNVNWTVESGVGSVTNSGAYTPPPFVSTATPTVLQGISAADPSAIAHVFLNVLPASGGLRIDTGAAAPTTDSSGQVWQADVGIDGGASQNTGDYPRWDRSDPAKDVVYESDRYGGADLGNTIVVANGNYRVHLLFGKTSDAYCNVSCSSFIINTPWDEYSWGPYMLEAQGQIGSHFFNYGAQVNFLFQKPVDAYIPARVTDNLLQVYVRGLSNDIAPHLTPQSEDINKYVQLNGLEILPDSSTPHWSIDTQYQTTISPGQTLMPFYVVDWYTGRNDPAWTIVSGPSGASINGLGMLSLGVGSATDQPIVVMASDGEYSATVTINASKSGGAGGGGGGGGGSNNPPPPPPPSNGWGFVRKLVISHKNVYKTDQTNFPVALSIQDSSLAVSYNGGHIQNPNGYDIVLASDAQGKHLLNWEVESWDPSAGGWVAHVRIPVLSHTKDTVIYMLYGNTAVKNSLATPGSVWENGYQGVYHFSSVSDVLHDSTAAANNGTPFGIGYTDQGKLAYGGVFTGGAGTLPEQTLTSNSGTIEMWVNSSSPQDSKHNGYLVAQDWNDDQNAFHFGWSAYDDDFEAIWYVNGESSMISAPASKMRMQPYTWNHVAYTWDRAANMQSLYLNGALVTSAKRPLGTPVFDTPMSISIPSNPAYYGIEGILDEARFSTTARSANWIKTEYLNQRHPTSFVAVGPETALKK